MERISIRRLQAVVLLTVVVLHSTGALAGTTTGSLTVTATVNSSCALTSSGAASFGAYDPVNTNVSPSNPVVLTTSFQLQCTNGAKPTILLGQGYYASPNSSDSSPIRNMSDGKGDLLNYQLYTSADRTTIWDNATGVTQTATGLVQTLYVYGSVPGGQNVPAGNYSDTVVITVSY
jgi:spore coat protein U-like protein